jgi:hypothetical protein
MKNKFTCQLVRCNPKLYTLTIIRKLLGFKKQILLSVPDTFASRYRRYGEETFFATKIARENNGKIHALKSKVEFWQKACLKFSTGNL